MDTLLVDVRYKKELWKPLLKIVFTKCYQSYNNHEKATDVLLEHGAKVTLTDDRGLNPLDFAKTRKMKKKLKDAWSEATTSKSTTSLGPIRSQSREDLRASIEDLSKRKKGEVIFEVNLKHFAYFALLWMIKAPYYYYFYYYTPANKG